MLITDLNLQLGSNERLNNVNPTEGRVVTLRL